MRVFVNDCASKLGRTVIEAFAAAKVPSSVHEDEDPVDEEVEEQQNVDNKYHIATVRPTDSNVKPPKPVEQVYDASIKNEDLLKELFNTDIVIYDIRNSTQSLKDAAWMVSKLRDEMESWEGTKVFVCISSIMTWARSKPSSDEEDAPLLEDEFRRRRAHNRYREYLDTEKLVTKMSKKCGGRFKTFVIAAGHTYGGGEDVFHQLFKMAWLLQPERLPIFGEGDNHLPCIHIKDLAKCVLRTAQRRPEQKYVVAVDEAPSTLREIVECISRTLGTGKTESVAVEEALTYEDFDQDTLDKLTADINIEQGSIVGLMEPDEEDEDEEPWTAREGLVERMTDVIKEYKNVRNLEPIQACVLGPPGAGKTYLATQLCKHYKLHHVCQNTVIEATLRRLKDSVALLDDPENQPEDFDEGAAEEDRERLNTLSSALGPNNEVPEDVSEEEVFGEGGIVQLYREYLLSPPCRNQGYVLDGFPENEDQARVLFAPLEDEEREEGEEDRPSDILSPEFVFSLEAPDEFLRERVLCLSEIELVQTHKSEEEFARKLAQFRADNSEDNTVLNFFDFNEMHPIMIDVTVANREQPLNEMIACIGKPHNYGPSREERIMLERETRMKKEAEERRRKEEEAIREAALAEEDSKKRQEWNEKLQRLAQEDEERLALASMPLRNYLVSNVMPTLTKALVEVGKTRPDDPIDFVAEYLLKHNPSA